MNPQQINWYLKKEDLRSQLAPTEIATLYQHSTRSIRQRGELIWLDDEAELPRRVYVVDQGYARICMTNDDGKRFILAVLGPGEFFGAIYPDYRPSELEGYLEVVQEMRLIAVEAAVFHDTLRNHPDLSLRIVKTMEERQRVLEKRLASIIFKDVTARTAEFLLEMGQKFAEACPLAEGTFRDLRLTHQEIAELVGASRPVVSQIIGLMMKQDILAKHNQCLCLQNVDELRLIAEQGVRALKED